MLRAGGHDAVHVHDIGLAGRPDADIMAWAVRRQRTVVTQDRDFPHLLRQGGAAGPSVVLCSHRGANALKGAVAQGRRLREVLPGLEADLAAGAHVTVDLTKLRSTRLPLDRQHQPTEHGLAGATPPRRAPQTGRQGRDTYQRVRELGR